MAHQLTRGWIQRFMTTNLDDSTGDLPVFQVRNVKMTNSSSNSPRWRMEVSDGQYLTHAMVTTSENDVAASLSDGAFIRATKFVGNSVQPGKQIIILLKFQKVAEAQPFIVNPPRWGSNGGAAAAAASAAPAAAAPPQQPQYNQYNNQQQQQQQRSAWPSEFMPIAMLNPYQNTWTIKARVVSKAPIKRWSNARGDGKLFSMELVDQAGTAIRCTMFREAVDKFYEMLQANKCYTFSKGRVKMANKQFSSVANNYELTFGADAHIHEAGEDASIGRQTYNFRKLDAIEEAAPNTVCDVCAVVQSAGDVSNFTSKAGKELTKRLLYIADDTGRTIELTLWGGHAESSVGKLANEPVVAFKGVKVGEWNGKSLGTVAGGFSMDISPDIPEAHQLQGWYAQNKDTAQFVSLSTGGMGGAGGGGANIMQTGVENRFVAAELKERAAPQGQRGETMTIKGNVAFIQGAEDRNICYPACPETKKKLTKQTDGTWLCEKTGKSFPEPDYRYVLSGCIADHTGQQWVTWFDAQARQLFDGKSAKEMMDLRESDQPAFQAVLKAATFKQFVFGVRARTEVYQDEPKVRVAVNVQNPLDYAHESQQLLKAIQMYG